MPLLAGHVQMFVLNLTLTRTLIFDHIDHAEPGKVVGAEINQAGAGRSVCASTPSIIAAPRRM